LWAALVAHSYLLCLLSSGVQVAALGLLTVSFVPGGAAGAQLLAGTALRTCTSCFASLLRGKG